MGSDLVTIATGNMPKHRHPVGVINAPASLSDPTGAYPAVAPAGIGKAYTANANVTLNPAVVNKVGGGLAHDNRMPFLVLNYVIALQGIFPSRG